MSNIDVLIVIASISAPFVVALIWFCWFVGPYDG